MPKALSHNYQINRFFFIIVLIFSIINLLPGQEEKKRSDTILIKKGNYYLLGDTIIHIPGDSIRFLDEKLVPYTDSSQKKRSDQFYDSLEIKADRHKWTGELYSWLFTDGVSEDYSKKTDKSEEEYIVYSGKTIRNIKMVVLDPFGPTLIDTSSTDTSWINKTLNTIHIKTRGRYIRNSLIFSKGDTVNPYVLSDNERIIRNLPYIQDARIIVIPVSDNSVDIMIIAKDKFSIGSDLQLDDLNTGSIEIYDKNILGVGHELKANLFFDYDLTPSWGYEGVYEIDNIRGSFIKGILNYKKAFNTESYGLRLSRKFFTPYTKYAGGLKIINTTTVEDLDTLPKPTPLRYGYQDYWFGRSFMLNEASRSRLILSARFLFNNIYERPEISETSYYNLQHHQLYLGSIAFSKQKYYKSNLIYNYGTVEDIPYGLLLEFTAGFEDNEFTDRYYTGLEFSYGKFLKNFGYLTSEMGFSGFLKSGGYEKGLFQVRSKYFTNLFPVNNYHLRQFLNLDYTIGIRPYEDEYINISKQNGIRGISSDSLRGTQRLTLGLETVAFAPFNTYGFKFAFYGFTDFGFIGSNKENIFKNDMFSALGIGIKIRNEKLVFKTFQIRFAFYPRLPADYNKNFINISGEKLFDPADFNVEEPDILEFR